MWYALASRCCPSCAGTRPRELREPPQLGARARACMEELLAERRSAAQACAHPWLAEAGAPEAAQRLDGRDGGRRQMRAGLLEHQELPTATEPPGVSSSSHGPIGPSSVVIEG